jgi:hypothetical protein
MSSISRAPTQSIGRRSGCNPNSQELNQGFLSPCSPARPLDSLIQKFIDPSTRRQALEELHTKRKAIRKASIEEKSKDYLAQCMLSPYEISSYNSDEFDVDVESDNEYSDAPEFTIPTYLSTPKSCTSAVKGYETSCTQAQIAGIIEAREASRSPNEAKTNKKTLPSYTFDEQGISTLEPPSAHLLDTLIRKPTTDNEGAVVTTTTSNKNGSMRHMDMTGELELSPTVVLFKRGKRDATIEDYIEGSSKLMRSGLAGITMLCLSFLLLMRR